jgi:hypothetical protein
VPMKRARTPSLPIEALNLFAKLPAAEQSLFLDGAAASEFGATMAAGLAESLADQRRLHGHWAQDLFRAVLISLDTTTLIKDEDAGDLYHDEGRSLHLPDFRIVTKAGVHLLVEVKNVGPDGMFKVQRIRADRFTAMQDYARLTGARLVFAHYWAGINWWTLVDAGRFTPKGKSFELGINEAGCANEFGLLGDLLLMTSSVITVIMLAAGIKEGTEVDPEMAAGLSILGFLPSTVHFACDGVPVTSRSEQELVKAVALYGGGAISDPGLIGDETGKPVGLVMTVQSPGGAESPNLGSRLSSIYSARYLVATTEPISGSVKQMRYRPDPALTRLAETAHRYGQGRAMPVHVFTQVPTKPPTATTVT